MDNTSPRRRTVMIYAIVTCCVLLGYLAIGEAMYYWKESVHHYESGAISALYALQTMQNNYRKDHGSYATTFSQLGVPLGGRLNGVLLSWDGDYVYRIIDIAPDTTRTGGAYRIDARPMTYSYRSRRSFLLDQTGTIHFTSANRAATVADPLIRSSK